MVSAEIGACRDSCRRPNFKGLRPNLEVESVAVEYGGNGGIGEIWSLQGFGGSASSGRDFGGYRGFGRTCRAKVFRLSLKVAGVSSAFQKYTGFDRSWRITGLRPNLEEKEFGENYKVKRVSAECGTRRGISQM